MENPASENFAAIAIEFGNRKRDRQPLRCGLGEKTLIISSIGTSQRGDDLDIEISKANKAVSVGADVVTDHSFYGEIGKYHTALVENVDAGISAVANYELAADCREAGLSFRDISQDFVIEVLEKQLKRGLDLITVHASFLQKHLEYVGESSRVIPTTSKGGGIISQYMRMTGRENPYFQHFDDLLGLFRQYGAGLSLGTSFRPATVCDTWDQLLFEELLVMGELCKRAKAADVPIMVEGIGHSTIRNIPMHIRLAKEICAGVPYRILPMATDVALGYDHISGAIAAAVAVDAGADAITCISRAEHIGLPSDDDLIEAVIAARVAAHCGEISNNGNLAMDKQMAVTRWQQGCKGDWTVAIYPEGARRALERYERLDDQLIQCTMCGAYCGIAAGISTKKHGGEKS